MNEQRRTGPDACLIHADEHWDETELTTGTYSFCIRCSDETIARNMQKIRDELNAKGHRLGQAQERRRTA